MTKLILSTSNIMGGGPSMIRRQGFEKSTTELTNALRANFTALQQATTTQCNGIPDGVDGSIDHKRKVPPFACWTSQEDSTLYVPCVDFSQSGLAEERSQYDITAKLFYLPNVPISRRCAQTREAVELVLKELHVHSINLLIVSFPHIAFNADDEEDEDAEEEDEETDGVVEGGSGPERGVGAEDIDTMIKTWRTLEQLHDEGIIEHLGVSEFGTARLEKFLAKARIRPSVDQINVRDCCVVPKPLILFAKQEKIELLTHNDCTHILPRGTLRQLLGHSNEGAGVLADNDDDGLRGELEPQWVVKYTAVVKDRGVIENKGYFAVANVLD